MILLGCDVGGTKTLAVLSDENGNILALHKGKGANYQVVGMENALKNLRETLKEVLNKANKSVEDIDFAFFGYAGADFEHEMKIVRNILEQLGLKKFDFDNDGRIALRSGTFNDVGIMVSCGTGSISYASDGKNVNRIGGLSFSLGERLGSHYIAGLVTSAVVRAKDGRDDWTMLVEEVEKEIGFVENLLRYDYEGGDTTEIVKKVNQILFKCAGKGDTVSLRIFNEIVTEVKKIVDAHMKVLNFSPPVMLILEGSFFKNAPSLLIKMIESCVGKDFKIIVPKHDPVIGALLFAMERSGVKITEDLYNRLIENYLMEVEK
ncbi:N-acetylglucosamine kinase [Thermotoga sp. KOL6]|uniref:N-acetylglucosamine kinase n=1 Tax=Thermotoga sp. KOL6 TaxID=126741 RepID=UPI000C77E4ED|nr:N-acetylglucosamine kinase [Thermotoga sp. KOL6]PLV59991.1 ATPase [Thermotoga sp. KOL6]